MAHLKTDTGAMSHFAQVPRISHSRNAFSIAEKHVTTMAFDYLYPIFHKYIYPGDTLSISQKSLSRLQTQLAVLYDDLYIDAHAWFVPMRLIQTNWARFQFNAQPSGPTQDNSSLTTPSINLTTLGAGGFASKSLYDYFGFPTKIDTHAAPGNTQHINNYLGRAYNTIWNQNYRDENLQNAVTVDLDEGPDLASNYVLLKRGKRFDKFTSCLTAQQKGAAVTMPLGTSAPVKMSILPGGTNQLIRNTVTGTLIGASPLSADATGSLIDSAPSPVQLDPNGGLYADLASASAATLNLWRTSIAVQHLLEADARGGTRDVESIQHRWGVTVPDFRLQRPEYLGGTTWSFDGHVVPQTSQTSGSAYQATLKQFSQTMNSFNINHSFVEHGVFMILVSARSNITYQQGLQRELSYKTRYDFYQPEFANLGEVAVKNKEIMFQGSSDDDNTFGFQEYAYELRYSENRVSAEMRSNYATPLDSRHMADDYGTLPTLGSAWIQNNTPIDRNIVVATATSDPIQMNSLVTGKIARTLPMYSIPGLMRL